MVKKKMTGGKASKKTDSPKKTPAKANDNSVKPSGKVAKGLNGVLEAANSLAEGPALFNGLNALAVSGVPYDTVPALLAEAITNPEGLGKTREKIEAEDRVRVIGAVASGLGDLTSKLPGDVVMRIGFNYSADAKVANDIVAGLSNGKVDDAKKAYASVFEGDETSKFKRIIENGSDALTRRLVGPYVEGVKRKFETGMRSQEGKGRNAEMAYDAGKAKAYFGSLEDGDVRNDTYVELAEAYRQFDMSKKMEAAKKEAEAKK